VGGDPDRGAYVVYLPAAGQVTVDLSASPGTLMVEWFDPGTGRRESGGGVHGGGKRVFVAPFANDAVLQLRGGATN
jgi:hypothetical protein